VSVRRRVPAVIPIEEEDFDTKSLEYDESHSPDYQYYVTYSIEPMLEVHWREDSMYDDTLYKVLFPITTPPTARPPFILDS
ncbi:hypothetical protein JZ751_016291, partial [Albula glossodonta]